MRRSGQAALRRWVCEQRPKEATNYMDTAESSRPSRQQAQRPCGRNMLGMFGDKVREGSVGTGKRGH